MAIRTWGGGAHGHHHPSGEADLAEAPIVAEINITPLTDVFLVLLVIFMVTSSVLSQMGVQVRLPKSSQAAQATQPSGVIVTVTRDSRILVNGVAVEGGSDEGLQRLLTEGLAKTTDRSVVLEGDREAVLGTIVRVMDIGKKAGASKFAVATSQ